MPEDTNGEFWGIADRIKIFTPIRRIKTCETFFILFLEMREFVHPPQDRGDRLLPYIPKTNMIAHAWHDFPVHADAYFFSPGGTFIPA